MTQQERVDFEERRRAMIGGSDCGAIMQVEGCRHIMDVWRSKVDPDFKKPHLAVYDAGNDLEKLVLEKFENKMDVKVGLRQFRQMHSEFEFIGCHLDGVAFKAIENKGRLIEKNEAIGLVEAKTAAFKDEKWGKEGTDEVPLDILFQVHHNMMCDDEDIEKCYIPVLFRGPWLFEIFIVHRDREMEQHILETEVKFWNNHVLTKIPPVGEESRISIPKSEIVATTDVVDDICEYRSVASQLRMLEAKKKVLRSKLNQFIGAYENVTFDGKTLATYKSFEKESFDKEKFSEDHPDLLKQYTVKRPYSQLRVK